MDGFNSKGMQIKAMIMPQMGKPFGANRQSAYNQKKYNSDKSLGRSRDSHSCRHVIVAVTQIRNIDVSNHTDPISAEGEGIKDNLLEDPTYDVSEVPPHIQDLLIEAGLKQLPSPSSVFLEIMASGPIIRYCTGVLIDGYGP